LLNTYVLRSPFFWGHYNTGNDFNTLELATAARCLQLLEYSAIELLVEYKILQVVALDAVLGGNLLQSSFNRDDDGHRADLASVGVDTKVAYNSIGTIDGFKLLLLAKPIGD
jgi:hypothetical protein